MLAWGTVRVSHPQDPSKMRPTLTLLVVASISSGAYAADPERTPLQAYQGDSNFHVQMCSMKYKIAQAVAEGRALGVEAPNSGKPVDSDFKECITTSKKEGKANLDRALKTVKKPAAKEALKAYHVAYISALDGIPPGNNEIRLQYNSRQQALESRMREAWTRFEIEQ